MIEIERDRFDPAWIARAREMGHAIKVSARDPVPGRIGRVHAVAAPARRKDGSRRRPAPDGAALVVRAGAGGSR